MAGYLEHSSRWQHHKTPTNKAGHWVGDVFHHGANNPQECDRCRPSVDYARPGFVRPDDPRCDCPGPQHDPLCRFWPLYVIDGGGPDAA